MRVGRNHRFTGRFIGTVAILAVMAACAGSPVAGTATPTPTTPSASSAPRTPTVTATPPTATPPTAIPSTATPPTRSWPTSTPAVTTAPPSPEPGSGSAADALVPFFAAVADIDARLSTAAAAVNAGLTDQEATFDQQTIDLVDAAAPWAAAQAIPAGLDPATEQAVLLVYSDLASRFGALRGGDCLQVGTVPRSSLNADCFVRGHEPKARLSADVAAARAIAESSAFTAPSPDSRAAAEVRLRVEYINKANLGCGTMGGFLATGPLPVQWSTEPSGDPQLPPTDGTVNGVRFRATYTGAAGWTVELLAC